MAVLVGYYDEKTDAFVFTHRGSQMHSARAVGRWKVVASIVGIIDPAHFYVLEDDLARELVLELADYATPAEECPEEELVGEKLEVAVTRHTIVSDHKLPLMSALPAIIQAKKDLLVGFDGYTQIELKLYRIDFTKSFGKKKKGSR